MERSLVPERLKMEATSITATKERTYWIKTVENFAQVLPISDDGEIDKLSLLTKFVL